MHGHLFLTLDISGWLEFISQINDNTLCVYGTPFAMWFLHSTNTSDGLMSVNVSNINWLLGAEHSNQLSDFIIRTSWSGCHNPWV